MSRAITIEKDDFGVCRISAQLLAGQAEKAVKACNAVGANSDAAEVVADAERLVRLVQENEADGHDMVIDERLLTQRLSTALRLHGKDIAAKMEWEQENLFEATELQERLNNINALVALCEGRDAKTA